MGVRSVLEARKKEEERGFTCGYTKNVRQVEETRRKWRKTRDGERGATGAEILWRRTREVEVGSVECVSAVHKSSASLSSLHNLGFFSQNFTSLSLFSRRLRKN